MTSRRSGEIRHFQLRVLALLLLVAVLATGCGQTTKESDSATDIATQFAKDLSAGDYEAAAALTTDPKKALADLNFLTESLGNPAVSYGEPKVTSSTAEGTADYAVSWAFTGDETWDYGVSAQLVTDDENDWKIKWAPTVLHPDLSSDTTISRTNLDGSKPTVVDRLGKLLLSEQLVTVVRIDPTQVTDPQGTATALAAAISPIEPSVTTESIAADIAANTATFSLVAIRESAGTLALPELPGVSSNKQARLLTADKSLRSPALSGLKDTWDTAAAAATGWRIALRNAQGDVVKELKSVQPQSTGNLTTTMDLAIQQAAQAAVDSAGTQAVIVAIQPSTGGILAVAQNAAADTEGPIALMGQYPPGSTFKLVTTSAALEAGVAQPDDVLPCPGAATINGRTIPNDDNFDLGSVPLHTAFAQSCNTTIAALGSQLPFDALNKTAAQYGVGVDYETPGLTTITGKVPVSANDAEQVEASIGQGKVVASPFGMALAAATVVAGKTPIPVLLAGQPATANQSPNPPSAAVLDQLKAMMTETVESGTASALSKMPGLAGKTGTAQYGDGTHSHGWFIATYMDMAFAVLLVGADSSKPAVTVAGQFLSGAQGAIPGA